MRAKCIVIGDFRIALVTFRHDVSNCWTTIS